MLFSIVMIVAAIISFAQCNPPRALWEIVPGAVCWDPSIQADWAVFGSAYSSFLDFVLALVPVTIVWDLKMSLQKKIGLCLLLGFGVLSASARPSRPRSRSCWASGRTCPGPCFRSTHGASYVLPAPLRLQPWNAHELTETKLGNLS